MMTEEEVEMFGGKTPYVRPVLSDAVPSKITPTKEAKAITDTAKRVSKPKVRLPYPPARSRAWSWLILQVGTAYRFKRFLLWSLRLPPRAWSFVRVVMSKAETVYEKEERDKICSECPHRHYRMRRSKQGVVLDEHCGKCGCPDWYYSRNEIRNGYSAWECPMRLHPGPYRDDDLREALKEVGYDPATVFAGGGCTGCGCGKAAQRAGA